MKMRSSKGFTLIELLIVVAIISIIAAIAVPGLLRSKMTANETSAAASLKAIQTAEIMYAASCGQNGYAVSFLVLGTPTPGTNEAFLGADLGSVAAPQKSGFNFTLGPGAGGGPGPSDCNGTATQTAFYATAVPQTFGTTGGKSFATGQSNTIWWVGANAAPTEPFGAPAVPIQ